MSHRIPLDQKFWRHVERRGDDDCWPWTGPAWNGRRGTISIYTGGRRTTITAPRVAWELHFGPPPADLYVLHSCDDQACVNPAHLHLGTHSDNMQEAYDRGLLPSPVPRMVDVDPDIVRRRYAAGESQQAIADDLGIGQKTVSRIVHRQERWA